MANVTGFPSHQIATKNKSYNWILQFIKAAWGDSRRLPLNYYWSGNVGWYNERKLYALGKQSTQRFVRSARPTQEQSSKTGKIDWSPTAILCKFREQLLSKLLQREYDIIASAVDELSRTEQDDYFKKQFIKVTMREQLQQAGSPLASSPLLAPMEGEPKDMQELQEQKDYSYKHILSEKMELGVQYIFQLNNMLELRKRTIAELFDIGLAGYKVWIDENGIIKLREVVAKNMVIAPCFKNDFSDSIYRGEVVPVPVSDLVPYFPPEKIAEICNRTRSMYGNPDSYKPMTGYYSGGNFMLFKVLVWDMDFDSWNTTVYEGKENEDGRPILIRSKYKNIKYVKSESYVLPGGTVENYGDVPDEDRGSATPNYKATGKQVIYKGKWIIGTDIMYDWGLKENMVRKKSTWQYTHSDYYLYAWNFFEMKYTGILERLIPIANRYQQKVLRLQDLQAKLIAYAIRIDLDALDSAAMGKAGLGMTPMELVDMFFQDQILVYRSSGITERANASGNPIDIIPSGQLQALSVIYNGMVQDINEMYEISGANQVTANSPDPKTNEAGINIANQNTNNAIYMVSEGDKALYYMVADAVVQKIQCAVQLGKVSGYVQALGENTIKYFELAEDVSEREFGIAMMDLPTEQQRRDLYTMMVTSEQQGFLPAYVWPIFIRIRNLNQAARYLANEIQKARQQVQQDKMQAIQMQSQSNTQSALAIEEAKQKSAYLAHQFKMQEIQLQGQIDMQIESGKKSMDLESSHIQGQSRVAAAKVQASAKVATSQPKQIDL